MKQPIIGEPMPRGKLLPKHWTDYDKRLHIKLLQRKRNKTFYYKHYQKKKRQGFLVKKGEFILTFN
jgi:hypothetical protein